MKNRLIAIVCISLILPGINDSLYNYSGKEFWVYYGILFIISLICTSLISFVIYEKE